MTTTQELREKKQTKVGFAVECLTQMKRIAEAGDVWKC